MTHMGAEATAKINRTDFGVNGAPGAVGNEISLILDVEMVKVPAASTN